MNSSLTAGPRQSRDSSCTALKIFHIHIQRNPGSGCHTRNTCLHGWYIITIVYLDYPVFIIMGSQYRYWNWNPINCPALHLLTKDFFKVYYTLDRSIHTHIFSTIKVERSLERFLCHYTWNNIALKMQQSADHQWLVECVKNFRPITASGFHWH